MPARVRATGPYHRGPHVRRRGRRLLACRTVSAPLVGRRLRRLAPVGCLNRRWPLALLRHRRDVRRCIAMLAIMDAAPSLASSCTRCVTTGGFPRSSCAPTAIGLTGHDHRERHACHGHRHRPESRPKQCTNDAGAAVRQRPLADTYRRTG